MRAGTRDDRAGADNGAGIDGYAAEYRRVLSRSNRLMLLCRSAWAPLSAINTVIPALKYGTDTHTAILASSDIRNVRRGVAQLVNLALGFLRRQYLVIFITAAAALRRLIIQGLTSRDAAPANTPLT
jgi:hypothetical protein